MTARAWAQLSPEERRQAAPLLFAFLLSRRVTAKGSRAISNRAAYLRRRFKLLGAIPADYAGAGAAWLGTDARGAPWFLPAPPAGVLELLEDVITWRADDGF